MSDFNAAVKRVQNALAEAHDFFTFGLEKTEELRKDFALHLGIASDPLTNAAVIQILTNAWNAEHMESPSLSEHKLISKVPEFLRGAGYCIVKIPIQEVENDDS